MSAIPARPDHPQRADPGGAADKDGGLPVVYTPAQAAQILRVRESWLRRKAAARLIPCTFLGRHLRFTAADLQAITHTGAQSPQRRPARRRARPG